jgi:FdhD protein
MAVEQGAKPIRFAVLTPNEGSTEIIERPIIAEAPIAIEYNGIGYAVMMATPIDLEDYAVGFSLSEGVVARRGDIFGIEIEEAAAGITLKIEIAAGDFMRLKERRRSLAGRTGCGYGLPDGEPHERPRQYLLAHGGQV